MTSTLFALLASAVSIFSYYLPQSGLSFEVTARMEIFHAGPYAKYASKYLGVQARLQDETTFEVTDIKLNTFTEADCRKCYSVPLSADDASRYLQMTAQGLICSPDPKAGVSSEWRFPTASGASFAERGIPANLVTESGILYGRDGTVSAGGVVEKSLEKKAGEVAEMIFKIRENRYKILVGDTDATYSGEAMKATIDELTRLERDYMTLFMGYSDYQTQTGTFDVVPDASAAKQIYVVFRLSEEDGLVGPDNLSGKPYFIELVPEEVSVDLDPKVKGITYRVPAVCKLRLTDGTSNLLQSRVLVYQLGKLSLYPVK